MISDDADDVWTMKILVRGTGFLAEPRFVTVSLCQVCGARVKDMHEHTLWHTSRGTMTRIVWCKAGGHEYRKGLYAPRTLSCQLHIAKRPAVKEKGKRMLALGVEKKESIRRFRKKVEAELNLNLSLNLDIRRKETDGSRKSSAVTHQAGGSREQGATESEVVAGRAGGATGVDRGVKGDQ